MEKAPYKDLLIRLSGKNRFTKDDCPFCINLKKDSAQVLWKNKGWAILVNTYPYTLEGKHIMLVPINHRHFFHEINDEELLCLREAYDFIKSYF